jgi:hypothetical protein
MKFYFINKNYLCLLTINIILFYFLIKTFKVEKEKEKQIENKIIKVLLLLDLKNINIIEIYQKKISKMNYLK